MPIDYKYDFDSNTVRMRAVGEISTADIIAYVSDVLADEGVQPGFIELVNMESVKDLTVNYISVSPLKDMWTRYLNKGCIATIVYAPSDIGYGTCRMIQAVVGFGEEDIGDRFVVVRTQEEMDAKLASLRT